MNELVSVIITTYKREHELKRAIISILNQTYENTEIIIIDDNCNQYFNDKVKTIVESIINPKFPIMLIQNKDNLGGAESRNVGIKNSKGNYIAFLDDDDEYYPQKIEKQMELMLEKGKNTALVYCYTNGVNDETGHVDHYQNNYVGNCLQDAMEGCIAATSQWLCRKEALESVSYFSNVPSKQDSTVIIKLLLAGYEVDRVPEYLSCYHEHSNERISMGTKKNLLGESILRDFMRENYSRLTEEGKNKVELLASKRILFLKVKNASIKESIEELQHVLSLEHGLNKWKTIYLFIKYNCKCVIAKLLKL